MDSSAAGGRPRRQRARGWRAGLARAGLGLAVAFVVLGVVEVLVRVMAGPPPPPPMVRQYAASSRSLLAIHAGWVDPAFQARDAIEPFPLARRPGRSRVLFVGGSSVRAGSGIPREQEFPALVEHLLGLRHLEVEALNLGRPGFDSNDVRGLVEEAMVLRPDLVVCYSGHNDIGNLTFRERYGTVRSALAGRLRAGLYQIRTYSLLERLLVSPGNTGGAIHLADLAALPAVEPGRIVLAESVFRQNLDVIARRVLASGAGLVLVTVVADEVGSPPTAPSCPHLLPPRVGALAFGRWQIDAHAPGVTLEAVTAALERDPDCADLLYLQGQLLDPADPARAEVFARARARDPVPIRATAGILAATREVARARGAVLVDLDETARRRGGGSPPPEWFLDSVHLSALGHAQVARVLADAVADALVPSPPRPGR